MEDIYKNTEEYNPNKKRKILIVFDDMMCLYADVLINKKVYPVGTELFIRGRKINNSIVFITRSYCGKINNSIVFITRSYFALPKKVRLNSTHFKKNESFNIWFLMMHQVLTLNTL